MAERVDATVLLATRDRARLLAATLAHLARQETDGLRWELVVVDNGSTDDTRAVLARARATLPLTALAEPTPGKNRALNRALPLARGELLVFTDDDVEPVPRWLAEHVEAARRWPAQSIFAGPIVPRLPPGTPAWLADHPFAVGAFGRYDPQVDEGPCAARPFGANYSVRARRMTGLEFRDDVGSRGGAIDVMGGETELLLRLEAAGERSVFVPGARIRHVIESHQTTPEWLARRAFRQGRTYVRLHPERRARPVLGAPARLWAMLAVRCARRLAALPRGERARFDTTIKLLHVRGQLYQHVNERRAGGRLAGLLLP